MTSPSTSPSGDDLAAAAVLLRSVLALVETGDLEATTPAARALLRRLEGAVLATEVASGERPLP